jgi:hypothetical protein
LSNNISKTGENDLSLLLAAGGRSWSIVTGERTEDRILQTLWKVGEGLGDDLIERI